MLSNVLEIIGMAFIAVAGFQVYVPLGLFLTGIFIALGGFALSTRSQDQDVK